MTYAQAERFFGGTPSAFAKALGIAAVQTVHSWKSRGIPAGRQFEIQVLTHGKLRADKKVNGK